MNQVTKNTKIPKNLPELRDYILALGERSGYAIKVLMNCLQHVAADPYNQLEADVTDAQEAKQNLSDDVEHNEHKDEQNAKKAKDVERELKAVRKAKDRKISESEHEQFKNAFAKKLVQDWRYYTWLILTFLFFGIWTFVVRAIYNGDLESSVMAILDYISTYWSGIPSDDFRIIALAGIGWVLCFHFLYFVVESKKSRYWFIALLVIAEICYGVSAIIETYASYQVGNIFEAILLSLPLPIAWIIGHVLFNEKWLVSICKDIKLFLPNEAKLEIEELQNQEEKLLSTLEDLEKEEKHIKKEKSSLLEKCKSLRERKFDAPNEVVRESIRRADSIRIQWLSGMKGYHLGEPDLLKAKEKQVNDIHNNWKEKLKEEAQQTVKKIEQLRNDLNEVGKKLSVSLALILVLFFGGAGCDSNKEGLVSQKETPVAPNVIVPTDLSDRMLGYANSSFIPVEYDLRIIEISLDVFTNNIDRAYEQRARVENVLGQFCLIPVPLPHDERWEISGMGKCANISELPAYKRYTYLKPFKDSLLTHSRDIYTSALEYQPDGADIWQFFDQQLPLYLKESGENIVWENKVIVLTDGYPYMEEYLIKRRKSKGHKRDYMSESDMQVLRNSSDWKKTFEEKNMGFLPVSHQYKNIEVLVVGLNPPRDFRGSATELQIIKKYWTDWFESMGIKKAQFLTLNSPATENVIREFLTE